MESGHAKNVANFEQTIIILTALGAVYNPPQALITPAALQTKLTESKAALAAVDTLQAGKKIATDEVQAEFEDLYKFVVNVKRNAEVELNDAAFTADLQSLVNKFASAGRKTGLTDDPATPEDESRSPVSTSQRSRDNQIAHLADIVELLRLKNYKSVGTPELSIAAIETRIAALTDKNNASKTASINLGSGEDARDAVLYNDDDGIPKLVKLIKTQLAIKPGKQSAAYQQIAALEFTKPRK